MVSPLSRPWDAPAGAHGRGRQRFFEDLKPGGGGAACKAWLARRRSASARVGSSGWAARHASIAPIIGLCRRTTTCSPGPVVFGGPGFLCGILLAGIDAFMYLC